MFKTMSNCHFFNADMTRIKRNNQNNLKYPDFKPACFSVAHCNKILVLGFKELPEIIDIGSSVFQEDGE